MTLTLEEVRNTKFHMARRSGYEVSEVDVFVDKVEAAFAQITEENQMMRSQLDALKESGSAEQQQQQQAAEPSSEAIEQARHEGQKAAQAEYEQKLNELKTSHANELKKTKEQATKQAKEQAAKEQTAAPAQAQTQAPAAGAQAASGAEAKGNQSQFDSQGRFVVTTATDAGVAMQRAAEYATRVAADADGEAKQALDNAKREAQQLTDEAKGRASRVEQEARANAERIQTQSQAKATEMERELGNKRGEMLSKLESERDQLNNVVAKLRSFEGRYRQNLTKHLQDQIRSLESGQLEPQDGTDGTSTPRLDALAGEQES